MNNIKKSFKNDSAVELPINIVVMLVVGMVALAALIAIIPSPTCHFTLEIEDSYDGDFLRVRIYSYDDDLPLTNVTLSISEHGDGRLLSGPYLVNETGYAILQIPNGYSEYFDIVGNCKDVTQTFTIDSRPNLVKLENKLGSLGTELIIIIFSSIFGLLGIGMGWLSRGKVPKTDKVKKKTEDKI